MQKKNYYETGAAEVDISSFPDGELNLSFSLYDYCDNKSSVTYDYTVYKDTTPQVEIVVYNKLRDPDFYMLREPFYYAQSYEHIYYEYNEFMETYKTFYVKCTQNPKWLTEETKIKASDMTVHCGNNYAHYVTYDETENAFVFTFDEIDTSVNTDILLEVSLTDSVGNEYVYTRSIPNGTDTSSYDVTLYRDVNNEIYNGSLTPNPQKISTNDSRINSFKYRLFYEFEWNDSTSEAFYKEYKNKFFSMEKYWYSDTSSYTSYKIDDTIDALNTYLNNHDMGKTFYKNKKYIRDVSAVTYYYEYNGGKYKGSYLFFDPYIKGRDSSSISGEIYNYSSINLMSSSLPGDVTLVYVPVYTYSDESVVYGAPVKKYVNYGLNESSSDAYTISFGLNQNTVSCGINTGRCKIELKNVKISDSLGNDVTDEFNLTYCLEKQGNYSDTSYEYFDCPVLYINSQLSEGKTCYAVVNAIKKDDSNVVLVEKSNAITISPVDNYPPHLLEIGGYHAEFSLYDANTYDTLKLPLIYDTPLSDKLRYSCYLSDTCLDTQNMFGVSSTDYTSTTKINFEYYWLKRKSEWADEKLPVLNEDVIVNNAIKSGTSYFTFSLPDSGERYYETCYTEGAYNESCDMTSDNLKMIVPVEGLEDGEYLLCVKISDQNGNYNLKPFLYHSIETYSQKLEFKTTSSNKLSVKLSSGDSGRNKWTAVVEKFDFNNTKKWIYFASKDITSVTSYTQFSENLTANYFYRIWIVGSHEYHSTSSYYFNRKYDEKNNYCYTKPVIFYYYAGTSEAKGYNLIEGAGGISILGEGSVMAQTYYCEGDGYGTDYDKWERYGKIVSPVFYSNATINNYSGYENVPSGCSYVVGAYFRNCTSYAAKELKVFSSVHQK